MSDRENIVLDKSYLSFCYSDCQIVPTLIVREKIYILSKQVLRSGTSIGANAEEAVGGISKADFRAKMDIA